MVELTEAEAAVYDRQLRVWGVETQKKLNAAKVMIAGFNGLTAEVAKNIVLAGVGSVTLVDDRLVGDADAPNFLVRADADPGQSMVEAAVATLREMNPLVKVNHLVKAPTSLVEEDIRGFQLLLLVGQPFSVAERFDDLCTAAGVPFYAANSRGTLAYAFANLHSHEFAPVVADGQPAAGPGTIQYPPLAKAMATPLASFNPRRTHKLLYVLRVAYEFEKASGTFPAEGDLPGLLELKRKLTEAEGLKPDAIGDAMLEEYACGSWEFPAVSAVLGGVLGNDVLTAVSHKGEPIYNTFLFSLHDNSGAVECLSS